MKRGVVLAIAVVLSCSPPGAAVPPADAAAGLEEVEPVVDGHELDSDGPDAPDWSDEAPPNTDTTLDAAVDAPLDATGCPSPGLVVGASQATLVPPPVAVHLSAALDCQDVSATCTWTAAPADVCLLEPGAKLRKVGDGKCTATCTLANGASGSVTLSAQQQTVIYVVGGHAQKGFDARELLRYRAGDDEWDAGFAELPPDIQFLKESAVGVWKHKLFVVGGYPDPDFHSGCTKTGFEKATLQGGCGTVWKLDLQTGKWSYVSEMPNNRAGVHTLQVGEQLYLFGGAEDVQNIQFDPVPIYRLDMATETLTPVPLPITYTGIQGTMQGVPFGKKILILDKANAWLWDRNSLQTEVFDLKFPCSDVKWFFALAVPGVAPVPLLRPAPQPCFLVPTPLSPPYTFLALVDGNWSQVPAAPVSPEIASSHQYVTADDAAYLIPYASSGIDSAVPWQAPVWRITKHTGPWEQRAPMPYARSWFGVGWGLQ